MTRTHQPKKEFNFLEELHGRQPMHWLGTPCFIKTKSKLCRNKVTIITYQGETIKGIHVKNLEVMDMVDLAFM